eukprot:CAMPEP_0203763198 /NCGR_PEP_ID=MMETSP0098-20131031/15853_1 /ASSEMBLY_ACC=CAM_ASM_000208 /TAXON_ID=96639 /ORGANISM=" , Strain NY0313808BC1" /LENGTH=358 /DNA_ID=CAMNT_0050657811 /DNA_START=409 /DNA_END=1481 /DNA_ORIENTATION=+
MVRRNVTTGTTILRGGKGNYKSSTLIGNWEEDREVTPAPMYFERAGYETTKGVAEIEGTRRQKMLFGLGISSGKHVPSDIVHYQNSKITGHPASVTEISMDPGRTDFQKQFGSKFPLRPAKQLSRQELNEYRAWWTTDTEGRDSRFVTENKKCMNNAVDHTFKTRIVRELCNVPVIVQDIQRTMLTQHGPHAMHLLGKFFRMYDQDNNAYLSRNEFKELLHDFTDMNITPDHFEVVFNHFDRDGSNQVSHIEFVNGMIGEISKARIAAINRTFQKLDREDKGYISGQELLSSFSLPSNYRDSLIATIAKEFPRQWDAFISNGDESKTSAENIYAEAFLDYYRKLSPAIQEDAVFETIL